MSINEDDTRFFLVSKKYLKLQYLARLVRLKNQPIIMFILKGFTLKLGNNGNQPMVQSQLSKSIYSNEESDIISINYRNTSVIGHP